MQRFLRTIKQLGINWYYWVLDYLYIGFWQTIGLLRRGNAKGFLAPRHLSHKPPVLLIPGIYERWEFMQPIARLLHDAGYAVHVAEGIGYNRGTIEDMARIIGRYAKQHRLKDCVIVAHSKGGLVGKYVLMQQQGEHRFKGMIALNTPFAGSSYAYLLPGRTLRLFTPDSPMLKLLATNKKVNQHITSIYGKFDPHIPGGSFLEGATNIQLPTYGHFMVVHSPKVHAAILDALQKHTHSKTI